MSNRQRSKAVVLFWKAHKWIYRASGGRIGHKLGSADNMLLTTTGRKSGLRRDIAIYYFEINGKLVIIGSNLGHEQHPAWFLNLKANPAVIVQIGTKITPMIARETEGEERTQLWDAVVALEPAYREYVDQTKRRIPVVVFEGAD